MAKKLKLNLINGNDTISASAGIINDNFQLLEHTFETELSQGVAGLEVGDIEWRTSRTNGPSSSITLSNGNSCAIKPIPVANTNQSGVITADNQIIGGVKTFAHGLVTNNISNMSGKNIITSDGNNVFVGGQNGILFRYDGSGNLLSISYPFQNGTDISQFLSELSSQNNQNGQNLNDLRDELYNRLQQLKNEYEDALRQQEVEILGLSNSLLALNWPDLESQLDGMVENWFGNTAYMYSLGNSWITGGTADNHVGDTFTITDTNDPDYGKCFRFTHTINGYEWIELNENEYPGVVEALLNSLNAISIADGKCTTFYQSEIPAPCYVGDIWIPTVTFIIENGQQVPFNEESYFEDSDEDLVVYMRHSMLFCIRDNDTDVPDINDWSNDLRTWAEIQLKKKLEKKFDEVDEAIDKATEALSNINDDNIFSVFEKMNFLNTTWYSIAGSNTFDDDLVNMSDDDFLGTGRYGSFRDAIEMCMGDNENAEIYQETLNELINSFIALGNFCRINGLFETPLESTTFETSRPHTEENVGVVAKQQLAELLYHYYREEEECKKTSYINAVATTMNDLLGQQDHIIQNWYYNGVPNTQETLPWRTEDEGSSEYDENDEKHIGDTLVDLSSPLNQNVYKFSSNGVVDENDVEVIGTTFYWNSIKSSDVNSIVDELGIDLDIATADGSINVFNHLPSNYTYGDIWFCNAFTPEEQDYLLGLNNFSFDDFKEGCIYYCSNTELTGQDGHIREHFIPTDWSNGYSQGEDFISMFAQMSADDVISPIEKNQLLRTWYEIAGVNLYGSDGIIDDDIIEDIFLQPGNTGSLYFILKESAETILGRPLADYTDYYTNFITNTYDPTTFEYGVVNTMKNLEVKFKDVRNALLLCGCLETNEYTSLSEVSYGGFQVSTQFNTAYNSSLHISMLPTVFSVYYMEEDNLKLQVQQLKMNTLEERLQGEINTIISASDEIISNFNSDNVFTVLEKRSFLNSTWKKIAGTTTYNPSSTSLKANGTPNVGYLGTNDEGTLWSYIKDMNLTGNPEPEIVQKFKELGSFCSDFGLFTTPLTSTNFGGIYTLDNLYDKLFKYLNEEELLRTQSYSETVSNAISNLMNQIDGQIRTWYSESDPPTNANDFPWRPSDTNDSDHIDDEFKNTTTGKIYLFKSASGATLVTGDVSVTGGTYYWKLVDSGSLASTVESLIAQLQGYESDLATLDGFIQVFGPQDMPEEYGYGDIWFFGGVDEITDPNCTTAIKNTLTAPKWVGGNIYYCNAPSMMYVNFDESHWIAGSNSGELTNQILYMTSDNWLSVSEKSNLLNEWYRITGIQLENITNVNTVVSQIEDVNTYQSNTGSYCSLYRKYMELNDTNDEVEFDDIHKALKDLYIILSACKCCGTDPLDNTILLKNTDTDLSTVSFPTFNFPYGSHSVITDRLTIVADVFNRYYTEEENFRADIEEFRFDEINTQLNEIITASEDITNSIDADGKFTVIEKRSFYNNTWCRIANSVRYDNSVESLVLNADGTPAPGYLGVGQNGTFWNYIKNMNLNVDPLPQIVRKFMALGELCEGFGIFDNPLQTTDFVPPTYTLDNLYDTLFIYLNEEENLRLQQYATNVDTAVTNLMNQIDGQIRTWYNADEPPREQVNFPWRLSDEHTSDYDDNDKTHINDEYKVIGTGKVYLFTSTEDSTLNDNDFATDVDYYWRLVDEGNIQSIINTLEGYIDSIATSDGFIQVFGPQELPSNYNYGDIWFFGGVEQITDWQNLSATIISSLSSWTAGNIYYCNQSASPIFETFNASHWVVGSNSGDLTNRFTYMFSDNWLSANEKSELLTEWYRIAGISLPEPSTLSGSDIVTFIRNSNTQANPNIGSYCTLCNRIPDNGASDEEITTALEDLNDALEDIYIILERCKCCGTNTNTGELWRHTDTDLTTLSVPNTLNYNYETGLLSQHHTIISDIFNRYYNYEENLNACITDFNISENSTEVDIEAVANQIGNEGFVLTSLVELKSNGQVTGGLDGISSYESNGQTVTDNVGLWFGGDHNNARNTIGGTGNGTSPVVITKSGTGSKIGPLFVGGSGANEHIYVGSQSGNVTVIGKDYISMGATYAQSNTSANANLYAKILLKKEGVGSRVGPLEIGGANEIFIGEQNEYEKVTFIGTDYISMGATYNESVSEEVANRATILLNRNGIGSHIGPLKVGDGYIFIKNLNENDEGYSDEQITYIGNNSISMGMRYTEFNEIINGGYEEQEDIFKDKSVVYLNREGYGSKIGPFEITNRGIEISTQVQFTTNGYGSKIGPLKVGNPSGTNDHIYIGNTNSGNVTIIGTDYISMGASYANSSTQQNASNNAVIYLDKEGVGSKIGPLNIEIHNDSKRLAFGHKTGIYKFRSNTTQYNKLLGTRSGYVLEGEEYTFTSDELNVTVYTYGEGDFTTERAVIGGGFSAEPVGGTTHQ